VGASGWGFTLAVISDRVRRLLWVEMAGFPYWGCFLLIFLIRCFILYTSCVLRGVPCAFYKFYRLHI
jgi:hypothetical protein